VKKVFAIVLCVLMLVTVFAGCGGGSESSVAESKWPSGFAFNEGGFKGQTLDWWNNWAEEDIYGHEAEFEEATGAQVEYSVISGGGINVEYYSQVANALAAGTGPDVVCVYDWAVPSWIRKGLLKPIDSVLDLNDAQWEGDWTKIFNKGVMDAYSYEGKYYAWVPLENNCYYCIYRKDVFEEAGLEDPYELWEEGKWTWDKFNEMMSELTYDSDDDGIVDKFGITGWFTEGWFGSVENGNYIRWREDGSPYFALTDNDMIAAMEQEKKVLANWYSNSSGVPIDTFCTGNIAMLYSAPWDWKKAAETFGGENLGCVQMPIAPSNTSGVVLNKANSAAYAITNNIDCEELVKHYLKYTYFDRVDWKEKEDELRLESIEYYGSEAIMEFDEKMDQLAFVPYMYGFVNLYGLCTSNVLWNYSAGSVDQLVQSIAVAAQSIIDEVFYDVE